MNNIQEAFNSKSLIGFIMAGDPDLETTKQNIIAMAKAGLDIVELGIPFSDPIAESSIIQSSNLRALKSKTYLPSIFDMLENLRKECQISIIFHTYINPVFNYGYEEFFKKCAEVGIKGILIPDLPFEEKQEIQEYTKKYGVDIISFVVPSNIERAKIIAKEAKGFVYLVPSIGSTTILEGHAKEITDTVEALKEVTNIPIALGFGINTAQQAEFFANKADGIIIGNGIVKIIEKYNTSSPNPVFEYVREIKNAIE